MEGDRSRFTEIADRASSAKRGQHSHPSLGYFPDLQALNSTDDDIVMGHI